MDKDSMDYVHRRIIADASLSSDGGPQAVIGRDAVMNISGRHFVVVCGGKEIFRAPHRQVEAYRMQSGNGMEFVHAAPGQPRQVLRVHFVQDVRTPEWHHQRR